MPRVELSSMDERSRRVAKRFEVPVLLAALFVIPVIVIEESNVGDRWKTFGSIFELGDLGHVRIGGRGDARDRAFQVEVARREPTRSCDRGVYPAVSPCESAGASRLPTPSTRSTLQTRSHCSPVILTRGAALRRSTRASNGSGWGRCLFSSRETQIYLGWRLVGGNDNNDGRLRRHRAEDGARPRDRDSCHVRRDRLHRCPDRCGGTAFPRLSNRRSGGCRGRSGGDGC